MREYGRAEWNPVHIKQIIAPAVLWQARYQVPVIVDEFGTIMTNAAARLAEQWLRDNRRAAERYGFGWTMWEHIVDFGFVSSVDDRRVSTRPLSRPLPGYRPLAHNPSREEGWLPPPT